MPKWLMWVNVGNQAKLTRLECLRVFLGRCKENGWLVEFWWRGIRIKVDTPIKVGTEEKDVHILLSMLDLSNFGELRDAAAILTMYQAGLRLATVGN